MKKPITWVERQLSGSSLIDLAYRDYIAARFLLNNKFIIQGLTLASTAIEKYLKSVILFNLKEHEQYSFHFDKIKKLQDLLNKHYFDFTEKFDRIFFSILENAYKIRYYDKLGGPIEFGFYLNQFIGELDYTVHLLETSISVDITINSMSSYKRARHTKDKHLYKNNYLLLGQDKKQFMEKPTIAFSLQIIINKLTHSEQPVIGKNILPPPYEGQLSVFSEFQKRPIKFY